MKCVLIHPNHNSNSNLLIYALGGDVADGDTGVDSIGGAMVALVGVESDGFDASL